MSQKRKHAEFTDGNSHEAHSSSKKKRPGFKAGGAQSRNRGNKRSHSSHTEPNANATNALKGRIRDLKRLLGHVDNVPKHKMPATVRIERERELETCEHELVEKTTAAREAQYRAKIISKYHQVRFFDRQKATRILKKLQRELQTVEDKSKKSGIEQKIHQAEVDVNYAIYYPLMKPYSSLYPKSKQGENKFEGNPEEEGALVHGEAVSGGAKGNHEIWQKVEQAMEDGTLDALRNRTEFKAPPLQREQRQKKQQAQKPQSGRVQQTAKDTRIAAAAQEEDDESDGGFFE